MTVAELIEELKKFDGSRHVMLGSSWNIHRIVEGVFVRVGVPPEKFVRLISDGDKAE